MSRPDNSESPRVAVVTGASAGIGMAICRCLSRVPWRLVLAARSTDRLESLRAELAASGTDCLVVRTDVTDPDDLEQLVAAAVDQYGRIDALINNAGVECFAEFGRLTTEQILSTIETNLTGAILLTRQVIPVMLAQRCGTIVNMSSIAGKHGPAFGAVYGATKAGLIAFTQGLRGELLSQGISATVVCPGFATSGGIYDRIIQMTGKKTPSLLGGTSADAVAAVVQRVLEQPVPEVIVNRPPLRPLFALSALFPRLGERLITRVAHRFLRRVAEAAAEQEPSDSP